MHGFIENLIFVHFMLILRSELYILQYKIIHSLNYNISDRIYSQDVWWNQAFSW